ncbi:MAG: magnesium transporter [Acidimicrobiales bacterium]
MRLPAPLSFVARLRAALGTEAAALRQAFAALLVSSGGDLLAGVTLAGITGRLEELPGLIILIPAAIGMRGNIYGALGSRLGTAIHTGQFSLSRRRETLVGQNIWASGVLTLVIAVAMAFAARAVAGIFGNDSISVADFVVISVLGGVLSSVIVLGVTLGVATLAVRRSWDMDNVAAPLVTASGDMVTLPSLVLASLLVGLTGVTVVMAVLCVIAAVVALVLAWRAEHAVLRRIVRESVPVLLVASAIDIAAGVTIEQQLDHLIAYPALLVLVPPFLEDTGALGGVLSSRLSSKLHLGIIEPTARPQRRAHRLRPDPVAGGPGVRAAGGLGRHRRLGVRHGQPGPAADGGHRAGRGTRVDVRGDGGGLLRRHRHGAPRPRPGQSRGAAVDLHARPGRRAVAHRGDHVAGRHLSA